MNPLFNDSHYLQELSSCLIQNLAHLIETRPRDPIEFLALSLKHHRRIHPRLVHTGQPTDDKTEKSKITSLAIVLDEVSCQLSIISSKVTENKQAKTMLLTNTNENDLIDEDNIDLKHKLFVHGEFLTDSAMVADLFDDDDIS
ncbi:unnamed protein product [Lymnaea stagnalis]|uniref:Uncharacterized protein n=1 Tax=Lymnaea stagnalis TaxID=6523 RepID=A0AAV2HH82_LYMST